MGSRGGAKNHYAIKALQRGLQVLDALLEARAPLSLEQICDATGLVKSTAFRIIVSLLESEYLAQTSKGYWLGVKVLRLGALYEAKLEVREVALSHISRLRDLVNETVHLAVLDDEWRVVYLEKLSSRHSIGIMMSRVGITTPAHCTGLGKAMIAFRPLPEVQKWLGKRKLKRFAQNTITEPDALLQELEEVRRRGYAIDDCEHEEQVRCIAAPVFNRAGTVVAAISVAGPSVRMPSPIVGSEMATRVVETAQAITAALGGSRENGEAP